MNNNLTERVSHITRSAIFSKDGKKRYKLESVWDEKKPKACIIMSAPSTADELLCDQTTMLCYNNAVAQNLGGISIVNVFCGLDFKKPETDRINSSLLLEECSKADVVIVAYGRGTAHTEEKERLLEALKKTCPEKLHTLIDNVKQPFLHPLSPRCRNWTLQKLS